MTGKDKQYLEREEHVRRMVVVGEFVNEIEMKEQKPRCDGYENKEMEKVLAEFSDVMSE